MFCLRFLDRQGPIGRTGIVIGDFRERIETSLEYWSAERYEEHWLAAVHEVVSGTNKSALLTSIADPMTANFFF